jgi:hypothetical protein
MRHRRAGPVFVPVKVVTHPLTAESKINTTRWESFLMDIKTESVKFREVLDHAKTDHTQVDKEFKQRAQFSFNAIHNVRRVPVSEDDGVFRTEHRRRAPPPEEPPVDDIVPLYPVRPDRPRPRAATALRLLAPAKLHSVYGVEAKPRDTFVLTGSPLSQV